jgi:ABC-type lipoprotein release transport system permease subunit
MNGFERDIREHILSRSPHVLLIGAQTTQSLNHDIVTIKRFYLTRMLAPQYQYQQINVIFSDEIVEPKVSTAFAARFPSTGRLELLYFKDKSLMGQPIAIKKDIMLSGSVIVDDMMQVYLPSSMITDFTSMSYMPMEGFWLKNPYSTDTLEKELLSQQPSAKVVAWKKSYAALFEALQSEKILMTLVLSFLIALIYIQLALTLLLIYQDKEKDMVALYFFSGGRQAVYRVFFIYGALNIISGTAAGLLLGWQLAQNLPWVVKKIETWCHIRFLPYERYYSTSFPSDFHWQEWANIGFWTLLIGLLFCHFIINQFIKQPIEHLLRKQQ